MDPIELLKKEMFRRKYSPRTIQAYKESINHFFNYCNKEPRKITKADIKGYLTKLQEKDLSGSTININLNALKFLMEEILNKRFLVKIKYSKTPLKYPEVLSKEEVTNLINNPKHKLIIKLIYSSGLRVSELTNLKVQNLEFDKNYGWVRYGKGNKDRLFVIADSIKDELINYIKDNNLNSGSWLFSTYNGNISVRTIQEIVKKATKKAKIHKNVHVHTLRHSFSTHLIENGYDITSIQSLLGHNSPETTMIYVHIASPKMISVKSPLDSLNYNYNGDTKNGL